MTATGTEQEPTAAVSLPRVGTDMGDEVVPLSKHLETLVQHEREKRELESTMHQKALELAAASVAGHIHNLNEFKQLAMEDRKQYVSRDVHDKTAEVLNVKYESLARLVYIGIGIALTVQFIVSLVVVVHEFTKKTP